jgi:AraC-like DNA-binding protein
MKTTSVVARLSRHPAGPEWHGPGDWKGLTINGGRGWQSNGGVGRLHPDRALPFSFELDVPPGRLLRVHLAGVFALHVDPRHEPAGSIGAAILVQRGSEVVCRTDLVAGRHYGNAHDPAPVFRLNGDGTSVETIGQCETGGGTARVDVLTMDMPSGIRGEKLVFRSFATPASFVVFDVVFELEEARECPFRGRGDRVALSDLTTIVRTRDRLRFDQAIEQAVEGLEKAQDLDEAKGLTLTFLAVVSAAMLDMEAPREFHRVQLDVAKEVLSAQDTNGLARVLLHRAKQITGSVMPEFSATGRPLLDRALAYIDRHFATDLQDFKVAEQIGLSTSHFRHLFRQAMRQPFHRYIVGLRLEKARELLSQTDLSVSEVAQMVGFASPAHFSRVFSKRFKTAPSSLRQESRP